MRRLGRFRWKPDISAVLQLSFDAIAATSSVSQNAR